MHPMGAENPQHKGNLPSRVISGEGTQFADLIQRINDLPNTTEYIDRIRSREKIEFELLRHELFRATTALYLEESASIPHGFDNPQSSVYIPRISELNQIYADFYGRDVVISPTDKLNFGIQSRAIPDLIRVGQQNGEIHLLDVYKLKTARIPSPKLIQQIMSIKDNGADRLRRNPRSSRLTVPHNVGVHLCLPAYLGTHINAYREALFNLPNVDIIEVPIENNELEDARYRLLKILGA